MRTSRAITDQQGRVRRTRLSRQPFPPTLGDVGRSCSARGTSGGINEKLGAQLRTIDASGRDQLRRWVPNANG